MPAPSFPLSSAAGWAAFALLLMLVLRGSQHGQPPKAWVLWTLALASLVAFRWPLLNLAHEIYPDESQLLAGAITLKHDLLFWRSVDGGTAGPIDYYALLPAAFLPGPLAYVGARWTAALVTAGILIAAAEAAAAFTGSARARLAALPGFAFAAFTTSAEFVHYSSELMAVLLLAGALGVLGWRRTRPTPLSAALAGLLLGLVPFAKPQVAPAALAAGLWLVAGELAAGRRRGAGLAVGAALLPATFLVISHELAGALEHMIRPYVLQNLFYASGGRLPLFEVVALWWEQSFVNGYHALWLAGSALFWLVSLRYLGAAPPVRRGALLIGALLLAAHVACIIAPGRPYHHYLHLLLLPVTFLSGAALALWPEAVGKRPGRVVWLFCVLALLPLATLRLSPRADPYAEYNWVRSAPTPEHRELVRRISAHSQPGDSLGIWGWKQSLYVETGLRQATSQAHIEFLLVQGASQSYYLQRYLERLMTAAPSVFVDSVGPADFRFRDRRLGHEIFPALRTWVEEHYRFAGEIGGMRLYIRRDRLDAGPG